MRVNITVDIHTGKWYVESQCGKFESEPFRSETELKQALEKGVDIIRTLKNNVKFIKTIQAHWEPPSGVIYLQ